MTGLAVRLLAQLDHRDRSLMRRHLLGDQHSRTIRRIWMGITQLGSAVVTIASVLLPVLFLPEYRAGAQRAALALVISHVVVQLLKRSVQRDRPPTLPLIPCPDRFSFPSGHATASLAIALGYAPLLPDLAVPLIGLALVTGWSRVVLGVHYPGDVVVGQLIAVATVLAVG